MGPSDGKIATLVEAIIGAVYEDCKYDIPQVARVMENMGLGYPETKVKAPMGGPPPALKLVGFREVEAISKDPAPNS